METINYHVVPLYSLVQVVQRAKNATIHRITHYLVDSAVCLPTFIYWIAVCAVDIVIDNNWACV